MAQKKFMGTFQKNLYITQKRMKISSRSRRSCQNRRQKAKEYLDKAKAELNGDVAIELLSRDGDSDRKVAEFIQGQLQETLPGLTINVKTVPLNNAIELMRKGIMNCLLACGDPIIRIQ